MHMKLATQLTAVAAIALCVFAYAADKKEQKPVNEPKEAAAKIEDLSKLSPEELKKKLGDEAYYVCIMKGTERPFQNKYWNNHEPGIYVDVISGKPLFASTHKFESGSGWPSFFDPIDKAELKLETDHKIGYPRTEIIAKTSGAHLGHLFDDGADAKTGKPTPTGMRYCINSAALKFVHKDKLKEAGLDKYLPLFDEKPAKAVEKK
jgi:methionine-R-sulfoxide reductase